MPVVGIEDQGLGLFESYNNNTSKTCPPQLHFSITLSNKCGRGGGGAWLSAISMSLLAVASQTYFICSLQ